MPGFSLYRGSKAISNWQSAVDGTDRGITVNTVSPGPTETEMYAQSGDDTEAASA